MNLQPDILIVEDDNEIRVLVDRYLTENGYHVSTARDGHDMDAVLATTKVDLIILDLMLPGEDGLALCRRLRSQSQVPILILSAKGDEIDRVVGLELGADDYIAKPFSPRELLARVKAVLRRFNHQSSHTTPVAPKRIRFLGWELNILTGEVRDPEGTRVVVTGAELELLTVFCQRPGEVLPRGELIELTRGDPNGSSERSVDILVSRLRRKIAVKPPNPEVIRTVRSGGYIFTADVTNDAQWP